MSIIMSSKWRYTVPKDMQGSSVAACHVYLFTSYLMTERDVALTTNSSEYELIL